MNFWGWMPGCRQSHQDLFYRGVIVPRMQKVNKDVAKVMASLGNSTAKIGSTHYLYDPFVKLQGSKGGKLSTKAM